MPSPWAITIVASGDQSDRKTALPPSYQNDVGDPVGGAGTIVSSKATMLSTARSVDASQTKAGEAVAQRHAYAAPLGSGGSAPK